MNGLRTGKRMGREKFSNWKKLAQLKTSSDILRFFYELRKKEDRKFSLSYICREAGISSKGYLSDIMNKKRSLKLEHVLGLAKTLGLHSVEQRWLRLHVQIEQEKVVAKKKVLNEKRVVLLRQLLVVRKEVPQGDYSLFMIFEIFAAFSLTKGKTSLNALKKRFSKYKKADIEFVLELLRAEEMVARVGDVYHLKESQLFFPSDRFKGRHYDFLEESIDNAGKSVRRWFDRPEESFFESSIISVDMKTYRKALPHLKSFFDNFRTEVETNDANGIVRFNAQVYPSF